MPATRLLVIADSKMLPALANGLRDGARFDVLTVPLSDPAGAQAAAEKADAVALFYGAPGAPLPAALQTLSPKLRDRGGRLVAVLQRDQAAQRDECFRAGASDLLFMPMPKDQFMARLQSALDLSWAMETGTKAPVSVATRTSSSKLEDARISAFGVEAAAELPVKAGETVRLSWGAFQSWGLVVRGSSPAQIRFAGLAPDEEAQIRDWLQSGVGTGSPAATSAPRAAAVPPRPASSAPAAGPPAPAAAAPIATPKTAVAAAPPAAVRAAPTAGPPPGFADRKPIRPQTRAPARATPPSVAPAGPAPASKAAAAVAPAVTPTSGVPAAATGNGPVLAGLFEDGAPAAPSAAPPAPAGPTWPVPVPLAAAKVAAMQLLKDKTVPAETPAGLAASARKITGLLGSAERAALEKAGPDSHFAESLAARVALETATAEGVKLYSASPAATIDAAAVAALTKQSDEAAARLQKEANAAVGKGEVEALQMITAASAALSRDHLHFKETADRLRGLSAAPRLGAGALDPDMVLPGQAPRSAAAKAGQGAAPVRAELRDFKGLDEKPGRAKNVILVIAVLAFLAGLANLFYFSLPQHSALSPEAIGPGIERIELYGESALVVVSPEWVARVETNLPALVSAMRERGVKKAALSFPNGNPAGLVDIATGKAIGLVKPGKTPPK